MAELKLKDRPFFFDTGGGLDEDKHQFFLSRSVILRESMGTGRSDPVGVLTSHHVIQNSQGSFWR